jgi:hypothetical protein
MTLPTDRALRPALRNVLDARGSNLEQSRLLFNATSDVDSLIEELHALRIDGATKRRLLAYCTQIFTLNQDEGEHERRAAGILDATVSASFAPKTGPRNAFTVKTIARKLRPALAVIAAKPAADAIAFVRAVRHVDEVLDLVPAEQLLTASVRNQLGPRKYELLCELVSERSAA